MQPTGDATNGDLTNEELTNGDLTNVESKQRVSNGAFVDGDVYAKLQGIQPKGGVPNGDLANGVSPTNRN